MPTCPFPQAAAMGSIWSAKVWHASCSNFTCRFHTMLLLFMIFHSARNCLESTTANLQSSLQLSNIHSPQLQPNSYWISTQQPHLEFQKIWQFGRLLDPVSFNFHQSGGTTLKCVNASHHIISPTPTLFEESRLVTRGTCAFRGIRPNEDSKGGRKWTKQNNLFVLDTSKLIFDGDVHPPGGFSICSCLVFQRITPKCPIWIKSCPNIKNKNKRCFLVNPVPNVPIDAFLGAMDTEIDNIFFVPTKIVRLNVYTIPCILHDPRKKNAHTHTHTSVFLVKNASRFQKNPVFPTLSFFLPVFLFAKKPKATDVDPTFSSSFNQGLAGRPKRFVKASSKVSASEANAWPR